MALLTPAHQKIKALCLAYREQFVDLPERVRQQLPEAVIQRVEELRTMALGANFGRQQQWHELADRYSLLSHDMQDKGLDIHRAMQRLLHLYRHDIKLTDPHWNMAKTGGLFALSATGSSVIGKVVEGVTDTTGGVFNQSSMFVENIPLADALLGSGSVSHALGSIGEIFQEMSQAIARVFPLYALVGLGAGAVSATAAVKGIDHHLAHGEGLLGMGLIPSTMQENRLMLERQQARV